MHKYHIVCYPRCCSNRDLSEQFVDNLVCCVALCKILQAQSLAHARPLSFCDIIGRIVNWRDILWKKMQQLDEVEYVNEIYIKL